jgi:hypothetical protein
LTLVRVAAGVVACLLSAALAACGGGGGGKGRAVPSAVAADDDVAQAANFRLTDFPPGWRRTPAPVQPPDSPEDRRFSECMGRPYAADVRTSIAKSDNFSTGELVRADSSTQLVRTEEIAKADLAALGGDRALTCLGERLDAQLATQTPTGGPPFTRRALERLPLPDLADDAAGFRMTVAAPSVGPAANLIVDVVFLRKGRVEISTSFVDQDRPFPEDLERSLLGKLAERAG